LTNGEVDHTIKLKFSKYGKTPNYCYSKRLKVFDNSLTFLVPSTQGGAAMKVRQYHRDVEILRKKVSAILNGTEESKDIHKVAMGNLVIKGTITATELADEPKIKPEGRWQNEKAKA